MAIRKIKLKSFVWQEPYEDVDGETRVRNQMSPRGAEVDLPEQVIAYGEELGAFVTEEDEEVQVAEAADVVEMDSDELMNWVSESTIPQVLNVAKTEPSLVGALVQAENDATGHDPRAGLVDGLAAIAGSGEPTTSFRGTASKEARALGLQYSIDLEDVIPTGDDDEVTESDVREYYETEVLDVTPAAREKAVELEVQLSEVTGTGKDGRIIEEDVEKYHEEQNAP